MKKQLRWGVLGLGGVVVNSLGLAIAASEGSVMVACAGRNPDKAKAVAEKFGAPRWYTTVEALCADPEVEAIYIGTPNALHHADVLACAKAKKPVLCEKPFALTEAEGNEMVKACRDAGVLLHVAFQFRFEKLYQRAREIVASGVLGELRSITLERTAPTGVKHEWRSDPRQAGVVFDVAVHLLDIVPWMTGLRFEEVTALSNPDRRLNKPDDTVAILGRLGASCNAVIRASRELPHARNDLVIEGTKGMLHTSALRWVDDFWLRVKDASGEREEKFVPTPAYQREVEAFESAMRGEQTLLATGEEGVAMIRLSNAILAGINERRVVSL